MDSSFFAPSARKVSAPALGCAVLVALAACAAPPPPAAPRVLGAEAAGPVAAPGVAVSGEERERQRRGVGLPPVVPPPGPVDRMPGALRASRPAPGTGPSASSPPPSAALPVPSNSLSRMSAVPASPLANPPGGFSAGRP